MCQYVCIYITHETEREEREREMGGGPAKPGTVDSMEEAEVKSQKKTICHHR